MELDAPGVCGRDEIDTARRNVFREGLVYSTGERRERERMVRGFFGECRARNQRGSSARIRVVSECRRFQFCSATRVN